MKEKGSFDDLKKLYYIKNNIDNNIDFFHSLNGLRWKFLFDIHKRREF